MDQTKNQGQDANRQHNPGQGGQQGNKPQGNQPGQGGQQNWKQGGGGQNPNRTQNPAPGSRDKVRGEEERGLGNQGEQNRESGRGSSGITNRGSDREMSEQQDLPSRGSSRSDRSDSNR